MEFLGAERRAEAIVKLTVEASRIMKVWVVHRRPKFFRGCGNIEETNFPHLMMILSQTVDIPSEYDDDERIFMVFLVSRFVKRIRIL